mgnify:CR=1 FL=1
MKHCIECGGELPETCSSWRKYCDSCYRERRRQKERERWAERRALKDEAVAKKPAKTIAEVAREAQANGLSYGQYVARVGC